MAPRLRVQAPCAGPGVFADLRLTALRSVEELVQNHQLLLAAVSADHDSPHSISNLWMASTRKHPFWLFTIVQMLEARGALAARYVSAKKSAFAGLPHYAEPHAGAACCVLQRGRGDRLGCQHAGGRWQLSQVRRTCCSACVVCVQASWAF